MKRQQKHPLFVLSVAVGFGALAGIVFAVGQRLSDPRDGFVPFPVNAFLVTVVTAAAAFLCIATAFVVFVALTRFVSNRPLVVSVCAAVAAVVGGVVGIAYASGPAPWIAFAIWIPAPAIYVGVTFPQFSISRGKV